MNKRVDDTDLLKRLIDRNKQSQVYIWRCQLKISSLQLGMSPKFTKRHDRGELGMSFKFLLPTSCWSCWWCWYGMGGILNISIKVLNFCLWDFEKSFEIFARRYLTPGKQASGIITSHLVTLPASLYTRSHLSVETPKTLCCSKFCPKLSPAHFSAWGQSEV